MLRVHRLFIALVFLFAASVSAQNWADLQAGNKRFRDGAIRFRGLSELRKELLADGQDPQVTILACADSRVPPELIFDQTLGRLFIVRVAGNVADTFGLASLKYAHSKGWTGTVLVLAHEDCGAVVEARRSEDPADPDVLALVQRIREGIRGTTSLETATKANAKASAAYVKEKVGVAAIPAYYDMKSGKVLRVD
jgi:carbonic anhydrase